MKNALFLTGAAARISQEVAIVDQLITQQGLSISEDETLLAGFSSGALNIAAINACFRKENPLSWDQFYKEEVLFNIKNEKVYSRKKFIPLNTKPLRKTIDEFLKDANQNTLSDFSFESFILAFSYLRLSTLWTSNSYRRHSNIKLSDLMMASTAIPFLFPDQSIGTKDNRKKMFVRGRFADGGVGGSFKRFEYYLKKYVKQNEPFHNIYIISPMREVTSEDYEDIYRMIPSVELFKKDLKDITLLKVFMEMISQNGFDTFIKRFYRWTRKHHIATQIYVCIPKLKSNYPILNFNKQQEQYNDVCNWAIEHPEQLTIPIDEYVKQFEITPLRKIQQRLKRTIIHRYRNIITRKYLK